MKKMLFVCITILLYACYDNDATPVEEKNTYKKTGRIERIDPLLDSIISSTAEPEIIAEGFDWSEGPVWVEKYNMLLFSDVPKDTVYKWTAEKGKEMYLTPSGYTDTVKRGGEMGSNGLTLDQNGNLVLCQCGNRQLARMDAPLDNPSPKYISLANAYNGKKFNSPNDAVYNKKGELFFTDPPYGLEKQMDDPKKEISYQGVYKRDTNGNVTLIADTLTRPNGIAFLNDSTLLVSNSDPLKPNWYAFQIRKGNSVSAKIFFSASGYDSSLKGLPDGMKVDSKGNVFATGPGGIWIISKEAKLLGKIKLDNAASNLALSPDEKILYVTNDMCVLRVRLRN